MKNLGPRVSICVPVYNGASTISQLLDSIETQTYSSFQVLIADDASSDTTLEKVEPFLADPRFKLIQRPQNLGFRENLNELIKSADGEFLVFPGQDDVLLKSFLERRLQLFTENSRIGVVHSRCRLINDTGNALNIVYWYWERLADVMSGENLVESLLTHDFICFPAAMVRRAAFESVEQEFFSQNFVYVPDWWLWLLLAARGWTFGYLGETDFCYRLHTRQLSQTLSSELKTMEMSLVVAEFTRILDGQNFGQSLSEPRRKTIRHLAHARLLRRGLGMLLRKASRRCGFRLVADAWQNDPVSVYYFPFYFSQYLLAKIIQRHECAGMPELFHSIGAR